MGRCLASAKELVDEIIIVDTGSTDNTPDIAREFGAKVLGYHWENNFSAARNHSLLESKGDWVLYLDADEELIVKDKEFFRRLLEQTDVEGYFFTIVNPTTVRAGSQHLKHTGLRLFRNRPEHRFGGAIHEQILPSILAANPRAKFADSCLEIFHHGYKTDIMEKKKKGRRNLEILTQQVAREPENIFARYNLAVALYENKDIDVAAQQFQLALEGLDIASGYAPTLFRNYVICLQECNMLNEALPLVEKGVSHFPDYTDLYYLKGQILEKLHEYTKAQDAYLHCLELGEAPGNYVTTMGVSHYLPQYRLGQMMENCGRYELAVYYYQRAFDSYPDFQDSLLGLGRVINKVFKNPLQVRTYIQDHIKATDMVQLLKLADVLYIVGDYHGALLYLNEIIMVSETKPEPVTLLKAKCLVQLKRWEEALYQYLEIPPESAFFAESVLEGCLCNWSIQPPRNAFHLIEGIKNIHTELYSVLRALNRRVVEGTGDFTCRIDITSLEHLLVKLAVSGNETLARLAVSLLGQLPEEEYDYQLGRALFRYSMYNEASDYLLRALEGGVEYSELYFMLGCVCQVRRLLWDAEQFLHRSLQLEPENPKYHEKLVAILLQQTSETLLEAISLFPSNQLLKDLLRKVKECHLQIEPVGGA